MLFPRPLAQSEIQVALPNDWTRGCLIYFLLLYARFPENLTQAI